MLKQTIKLTILNFFLIRDIDMSKVRVYVPCTFNAVYVVEVKDSGDIEEIKEAMRNTDAGSFVSESAFESLGDQYEDAVEALTIDAVVNEYED